MKTRRILSHALNIFNTFETQRSTSSAQLLTVTTLLNKQTLLMERNKEQKKKKIKQEIFEKRSPLQDLNGHHHHIHKTKSSTLKSSNSSSRSHFNRKPKIVSKFTKNALNKPTAGETNVLPKSKENQGPTKLFSHKSNQLQSGKEIANPRSRIGQRLNLSSDKVKLKRGFRDLREKSKISGNSDLNCVHNCTPIGKIACGSSSDLAYSVENKIVGDELMLKKCNDNNSVKTKTPPVEASVSPEIQFGSHAKLAVSISGVTPVCYGAGHLLSGVTDKRKCRRRGSLKGGCEKVNLFDDVDDERSDGDVIRDSSVVPLLAEASVRWHLSPCDEGHENEGSDSEVKSGVCRMSNGDGYDTLDLLSAPSSLCGDASEVACCVGSFRGSGSVGDVESKNITNDCRSKGIFEPSNEKMDEHLLVSTPNCNPECNNVSKVKGQIEDYSTLSIGSLSSGNVIHTPSSDTSLDMEQSYVSEFGSIRQTLKKVVLSPRSEMFTWDESSLGSDFAIVHSSLNSQLQKSRHNASSAAYGSPLENLSLSQMKISWRDGLVTSNIVESDEYDSCLCLSDEEIYTDGCSQTEKENDDSRLQSYLGNKSGANNENHQNIDRDISPMILDYEPVISKKDKETLHPHIYNPCAESICTKGGSLVASADSDWGDCFSDHLCQI